MSETDPKGLDAKTPGAKLDAGKPEVRTGVLEYFPRALVAVAEVSAHGAQKYVRFGWQKVPNGIDRYGDAGLRHALGEATEGAYDSKSGLLHAAHEAWNALARLELILRAKEENDQKRLPDDRQGYMTEPCPCKLCNEGL